MKTIECKIVDGVIYPSEPMPDHAVRIHFDGTSYQVAESTDDEKAIIDSCASLKVITEAQRPSSEPTEVGNEEPADAEIDPETP